MSSISNPLRPRMPYEAAEALLWERQNARANTHLLTQMKALQSAHDAYDARIAATEAVAEAAEAAVSTVRLLERKVDALEADEREGPFVAWVKEAVGQLQGSVEAFKGVRRKVSEVEREVERLGEDVDEGRDVSGVLKGVVRRLEVLEGERREDGRRLRELEGLVERLREGERLDREVVEESYGEAQADDNPLAVFYGIETQAPDQRQDHDHSNTAVRSPDRCPSRLNESPQRHEHYPQPQEESIARPEDDSSDLFEPPPVIDYGWENTQQFKDMQKELEALRAMCRTQEPKSGNQTADATQRPQETLVVGSANNVDFSDATTEMEAELNDHITNAYSSAARVIEGVSSSNIQLPSSPPKRAETQSARRNLMKRPSIQDPRVLAVDEHARAATTPRGDLVEDPSPSLLVGPPVESTINKASAKRKRVDDAPAQRVTRPKLSDDRAAVPSSRESDTEHAIVEHLPLISSDETPAPTSPTPRTSGNQCQAVNRLVQPAGPQAGPSKPQPTQPAVKPSKPKSKPKPKPVATQQPPATSSSSKQVVKKETKRQPTGACKSCRTRHQKCDRMHPACGRCVKFGTACEYPAQTAPSSSPKKKTPAKYAGREGARSRSVTVSPEPPRQKSAAKRPVAAPPSKKPNIAAATAASSRAPRAKNKQVPRASPKKK